MSDQQFFSFLTQCRDELRTKQDQLIRRASSTSYQFDLEAGSFFLGVQKMSCVVVGSYCPSRSTWLWAWANDIYSHKVRESSARFQKLFETTGFRVFVDEGIHASRQDAEDFTAMAVHLAGGVGFWRALGDDVELYLCLVETDER